MEWQDRGLKRPNVNLMALSFVNGVVRVKWGFLFMTYNLEYRMIIIQNKLKNIDANARDVCMHGKWG